MKDDDIIDERRRRGAGGERGGREETFKAIAPARKDLTPELQAVPEDELRAACETLRAITIKVLRSKARALELYWAVWQKLVTTRRFDPTKGPLVPWLIFVAKSEYLHAVEKETTSAEHDAVAHEGYHREEVPLFTGSPEEQILEHAENARREARASEDAEALRARAAEHPIALRVFELQMDNHKPSEIAEILGVTVKKVYEATDSLKDYLKEIQNARREERDENESP